MVEIPRRQTEAEAAEAWENFFRTNAAMKQLASMPAPAPQAPEPELDWPPGILGQVARDIYCSSARPVKTVAIASALALLAGVCGKSWNTYTGAGLNLYLAVVARSGVGKEAIADAIPALIRAASKAGEMHAASFYTFNSMASGQGLIKFMGDTPYSCVLHVSGEFGHDIQFMATDKTGPHATLRQQMTKLYSKSAPTSMAGGISYANLENSVTIEGSASYSIIGETTPGTFYEALNGKMMADGFLSRFVVIEYDGPRPPLSENRQPFPDECVRWFSTIVAQASQHAHRDPLVIPVSPEGLELLRAFDKRCDHRVNATDDESRRQMWNRAHLNALKVASLLAVADNHLFPTVTQAHADWAINLILRNIANMAQRMDGGDVGEGDSARERKLVALLNHYRLHPIPASYKIPDEMRQNFIVPRSYLSIRVAQNAAFYNHRFGATRALDETIQAMIANGYLMEVQKDKLVEAYSYHGRAYRIIKTPDYEADDPKG